MAVMTLATYCDGLLGSRQKSRWSAAFEHLVVNEGQQLIGGSGIAVLGRFKNARDVAHAIQSGSGMNSDNPKRTKNSWQPT
jgi:hypothetical protein